MQQPNTQSQVAPSGQIEAEGEGQKCPSLGSASVNPKPFHVIVFPYDTAREAQIADFAYLGSAMTYCGFLQDDLKIPCEIFVFRDGVFMPWDEV